MLLWEEWDLKDMDLSCLEIQEMLGRLLENGIILLQEEGLLLFNIEREDLLEIDLAEDITIIIKDLISQEYQEEDLVEIEEDLDLGEEDIKKNKILNMIFNKKPLIE